MQNTNFLKNRDHQRMYGRQLSGKFKKKVMNRSAKMCAMDGWTNRWTNIQDGIYIFGNAGGPKTVCI